MRASMRGWIAVVGLGAVLASSTLAAGCVVRARARVTAEPVYVVEEAPPPPREERITVRPGYVWTRGRWERRGDRWEWRAGAWQRERRGYVWQPGHWERRGNRYYWVEGRWEGPGRARVERRTPPPEDVRDRREPGVRDRRGEADHTVSVHPTAPPPAPRPERIQSRRGYVWVGGNYRWRDGSYEWVAGHWERERRGFAWQPGHWERRGSHYVWIEGSWQRR